MNRIKMKRRTITIIAVLILLTASLVYLGIKSYNEMFQQGAQYGYEQTIIRIANDAKNCTVVSLTIYEETVELVAVRCLQQTA